MHSQNRLRHRHLVALPISALALWFSMLPSLDQPLRASLIPANLSGEYQELDQGVAEVDYGAGKRLLSSPGMIRVAAREYEILSTAGAFWLAEGTESITIAALTAPVLVQAEDFVRVVPIGYQWQSLSDGLYPIPSSFAKRYQNDVHALPEWGINDLLPVAVDKMPTAQPKFKALALKKARVAEQKRQAEKAVAHARFLLEERNASQFANYLNSVTTWSEADLSQLLKYFSSDPVAVMPIVEHLAQSDDWWLLLSIHPQFRDLAWQLPVEDHPKAWQLARLKALPASLSSTAAPSDLVLDRWQEELVATARLASKKPVFIHGLTKDLARASKTTKKLGYPKRADHLKTTASSVHAALPAFVRSDTKKLLAALTVPKMAQAEAPRELLAEPDPGLTPDQVEALANELLQRLEVFRTTETTVTPLNSTRAQVTQVAIPVVTDILLLDFKLKVTAPQQIEQITLDGKTYGNAMTVEGFKKWVKSL